MSSSVKAPTKSPAKSKSKSAKVQSKSKSSQRLVVVFDSGTSVLKILYVVNDTRVKWMTMGAEYFPLPASRADSLNLDLGRGEPEDHAWFRTNKSGDCHTVGLLARNQRATTSIKKTKKELLAYKIMAAIGAISSREDLSSSFELELGVLIPYNEYRHLKEDGWVADLKKALASFYFQDQRLRVKLLDFLCMPEGYGIANYLNQESKKAAQDFNRGNSALIMLGHRNTSCLFFRRGTISHRESGTSMLGFHTLLEKLLDKFPGLSPSDFINAMTTNTIELSHHRENFNYAERATTINWAHLLGFQELEEEKLQRWQLCFDESLAEYWRLLADWLDEILPTIEQVNVMVFAGGSYHLLESQLSKYAKSRGARSWESEAKNHLKKYLLWQNAPQKERFMRENLGLRFADAWGFFLKFANYDESKVLERLSGEVVVKPLKIGD